MVPGWYLGPTMENYYSYLIGINSTAAEHTACKLKFKHHTILYPKYTSIDCIIWTKKDLQDASCGYPNNNNTAQMDVVKKLREIILGINISTNMMLTLTNPSHLPKHNDCIT